MTGAAKGIGKEITQRLLSLGHKVIGFDIDEKALETMVSDLAYTDKFLSYKVDVTSESEIKNSVKLAHDSFGPITILVNNAGGSMSLSKTIETITTPEWDLVIEYNLKSTFLVTKAVVPFMKEAKWGRIVNFASIAGRGRSYFGATPYASAKAGIIGFTRQGSRELGPYGITMNAVAPGVVNSGERISQYWQNKTEEEKQALLNLIPVGRLGTNQEIAAIAAFLCSDESSYITGAVIDVNGGFWVG